MSPSAKKLVGIALILSVILIAFVVGESLGARYALIREMQLHETVLARNLPIFSYCKVNRCDENIQKALLQANDAAIQQYALLENTYMDTLNRSFWYVTGPVGFSLYFDPQSVTPTERLRGQYKKLECGLNGIVCVSVSPEGVAK